MVFVILFLIQCLRPPRMPKKSAAMAYTTAALYIVLHTRHSWCLRYYSLTTTFGYHALCCSLSKVVVIAVTSRGTQSLFINVRLSAGLYEMLSVVEESGFEPEPMPTCTSLYLCFQLHHSPRCGAVQPSESLGRRLSPLISSSPHV